MFTATAHSYFWRWREWLPLVLTPSLCCRCYPGRYPHLHNHRWRNHCSTGRCGNCLRSQLRCQCSFLFVVISGNQQQKQTNKHQTQVISANTELLSQTHKRRTNRCGHCCSHLVLHIDERTHVQLLRECHPVIELDAMHGGVVKVKSLQLQCQQVRKMQKSQTLDGVGHMGDETGQIQTQTNINWLHNSCTDISYRGLFELSNRCRRIRQRDRTVTDIEGHEMLELVQLSIFVMTRQSGEEATGGKLANSDFHVIFLLTFRASHFFLQRSQKYWLGPSRVSGWMNACKASSCDNKRKTQSFRLTKLWITTCNIKVLIIWFNVD